MSCIETTLSTEDVMLCMQKDFVCDTCQLAASMEIWKYIMSAKQRADIIHKTWTDQ